MQAWQQSYVLKEAETSAATLYGFIAKLCCAPVTDQRPAEVPHFSRGDS